MNDGISSCPELFSIMLLDRFTVAGMGMEENLDITSISVVLTILLMQVCY